MTHDKLNKLFEELEAEMEKQTLTKYSFDTITGWKLRFWYNKKHDERNTKYSESFGKTKGKKVVLDK